MNSKDNPQQDNLPYVRVIFQTSVAHGKTAGFAEDEEGVVVGVSPTGVYNEEGIQVYEVHTKPTLAMGAEGEDDRQAPFRVYGNGAMYAQCAYIEGIIMASDGVFNGTVYATDGSFTGTVNATDGTFNGDVHASNFSTTGTYRHKITFVDIPYTGFHLRDFDSSVVFLRPSSNNLDVFLDSYSTGASRDGKIFYIHNYSDSYTLRLVRGSYLSGFSGEKTLRPKHNAQVIYDGEHKQWVLLNSSGTWD